jgi:hypothetical protein
VKIAIDHKKDLAKYDHPEIEYGNFNEFPLKLGKILKKNIVFNLLDECRNSP